MSKNYFSYYFTMHKIFVHVLPVSIFVSFFKDFDPVTVGQKFNLADVTASGTRRKMRYLRERFESNWAHHNVAYFELILANLALASAQLLGQIRTKDCPEIIRTIFSGSALIRTNLCTERNFGAESYSVRSVPKRAFFSALSAVFASFAVFALCLGL